MATGIYSLGLDFGNDPDPDHIETSPYWVIAVIPQGTLLTFSRKLGKSRFNNLADDPVLNTTPPLIISDDCLNINVDGSKRSPIKTLSATLKQTDVNYITSVFPGDYLFCWIVNNRTKYLDIITRLKSLQPCNKKDDGLKFIGRVQDVRKRLNVEGGIGTKTIVNTISASGFTELETVFFYDYSLASNDAQERSLGTWLARMGQTFESLFGSSTATGIEENNINKIIPTLLNLIIGSGPSKSGNIPIPGPFGTVTPTPTLDNEAPYAYVIPATIGKLLGKTQTELGKPTTVLAYADILNLTMGIQSYSNKSGLTMFVPDLRSDSTPNRSVTTYPLLGTFLAYFTEFSNIPIWSLMQKYLNPTINEMYTALQINSDGNIVPTVICRQIPFTTEAFQDNSQEDNKGVDAISGGIANLLPLNVTKFLDLPRWFIPTAMILGVDIGRTDAMRKNFIHVYGSAALQQNNVGVNEQIVLNPPIRDDLSIQTSGLHSYMTTVECFVSSQTGRVPSQWMNLIADWSMGGHLTINGTIQCMGIQSPIEIGQNIQFEGVAYHIEAINHSCGIDPRGIKYFRTTMQLSNGMRIDGKVDSFDLTTEENPIYAGLYLDDQRKYDPGLSLEGPRTINADENAVQNPLSHPIPDVPVEVIA